MGMRRRNLETMGHSEQDARSKGAWTPFVGVALAALTAGSLVVFSVVAQRTSLGGFSTRGVTAIAPSTETPSSITLPARDDANVDGTGSSASTDAPSLLTLIPAAPLVAPDGDTTLSPAGIGDVGGTTAGDTDRRAAQGDGSVIAAANDGPRASFSDAGGRGSLFRTGETEPGGEGKRASDDRGKKKGGKGKGKAKGKAKGKNDRENHGHKARKKGRGHGRASSGNQRQGRPAATPQPARSSRPAKQPKPKKAAKPKGSPSHSNSSGKRHSKGRGRGHAHD